MKSGYLFISSFIFLAVTLYGQGVYESRNEIPVQYKWNLNDIYPDWNAWDKGLKEMESKMGEIVKFKGKLKESPENLLKVQKLNDEIGLLSYYVYRYPQLNYDLDTRNTEMMSKLQQVQISFAKFNTATSWINPEILEIPWEKMEQWLNSNKEFEPYKFGISNLYRLEKHVLDADKENLLSLFSQFNGTPPSIYTSLSAADVDFPLVKLSTGELKATNGNYQKVLATDMNQENRRLMYEAHYNTYKKNHNTYAAIYNSVCQRDWANAKSRNYSSSLEAALEDNNIPTAIYENLVNTVKQNTEPLKKYIRLRKKVLGLEKYFSYDGSIPVIDFTKTYPFEQAKEYSVISIAPLGKEYADKYKKALNGGWVDVFENTGKRPGAYSAGVYGVHPYMLLNYNETLDNVFTLAHEMGHTMHTLLSDENQPFATSGYTIFVAEVASTFNEALLLDYLLKTIKDPKERITFIQQAIRNITGTFYFQALLADFELQVHTLVEQGKPVTTETLTKIMDELNKAYYGDEIEDDELIDYVWARIPHIYSTPFYVYQYATSLTSSSKLYSDYQSAPDNEKQKVLDRYLTLLKSGGNDYPMEQLKKAGVDLSKPEAVQAVINRMDELVNLLEQEVNKL